MQDSASFFALIKHLQQLRIASQRESLGVGWRRRYERLSEQLGDVAERCDQRDLGLVKGLRKDASTQHYDVDIEYLQDFSLQFFERYTAWTDDLGVAETSADEDDESADDLKQNPLYQFAKKR